MVIVPAVMMVTFPLAAETLATVGVAGFPGNRSGARAVGRGEGKGIGSNNVFVHVIVVKNECGLLGFCDDERVGGGGRIIGGGGGFGGGDDRRAGAGDGDFSAGGGDAGDCGVAGFVSNRSSRRSHLSGWIVKASSPKLLADPAGSKRE